MIKLSVITATYNRASILNNHITKILSQNYDDFEFIIVDDCSTDNTKEVVQSFKNQKLKYICQKENGGTNKAIQKGINIAQGEYLYLIADDDELVDLNFFNDAMKFGEDIITAKYQTLYNNTLITSSQFFDKKEYEVNEFLSNWDLFSMLGYGGNTIFKKKLFTSTVEEVEHDFTAIFLLLLNAKNIKTINRVVFHWKLDMRRDTISTKNIGSAYNFIKRDLLFMDELIPKLREIGQEDKYKEFIDKYIFEKFQNVKHNYNSAQNDILFKKVLNSVKLNSVYIYGKGFLGIDLKNYLIQNGVNFIAFIDDLRQEEDTISLENVHKEYLFIIASYKDVVIHKMYKRLISNDISYKNIVEII